MSLSFTLQDNINASSRINRYSVVQKLKNTQLLELIPGEDIIAMQRLWMANRSKVHKEFLNKLNEYFLKDEQFGLLVPPTNRRFFTDPLKLYLQEEFPNSIDITEYFTKPEGVSFGAPPYSEMPIEELRNLIEVTEEIPEIEKINKFLLVDDVYANGKTMAVLKLILNEMFNNEIEIISGTIIRTRN